ncbi:MAG: glycerophosphodiester phosphodiesterase family protein [Bryobacteraceae bacterium]|nr:glycerophosphodiester phosphodiesterase family protein [Bryobacteraceae bacterium]
MTRRTLLMAALAPAPVQVIAHRGGKPDNTLTAIEDSIRLGVDWVELDVRTTPEGKFVLSHDAFTDASGLPTFDDALDLLRPGGCRLYLDAKQITAPAIVDRLRAHRMLDRSVVYGSLALHRALFALRQGHLCMPEAVSAPVLKGLLDELKPKIIAFDRNDFRDEVLAVARAARVGIFVDRLGKDDNEAAWLDAAQRGATGIQTDHPADLLRVLRRHK